MVGEALAVMPWKLNVTLQTMPGIDRGHQRPHTRRASSVFIATLHLGYTDGQVWLVCEVSFFRLRATHSLSTAEVFA